MRNSNISGVDCQPAVGVIYKITCLINGKLYVGQTRQKLSKRIAKHKYYSKQGRPGIDAAIAKYGWENFSVEVIESCPVEQLNERELFWIAALNTKASNGYNLTDGGDGCTGFKHTAESCAKISANHADVSGENNPNYRKPLSEEQKAKISANHADVSEKNNPNYGKPLSEKRKAELSAFRKGKKFGPRPPEVGAKISIALKAYHAKKKLESQNNP